jgi:outer membrane protein TolC
MTPNLAFAITLACLTALTFHIDQATARAAPPPALAELIRQARNHDASLAASMADVTARERARDVESGALWPRLEATVGYTRNQHDATVTFPDGAGTRTITITPYDQLEANVRLTIPLLDLGRRARIDATDLRVAGTRDTQTDQSRRTDELVAAAYFQAVFAAARRAIADADLLSSQDRKDRITKRQEAGFANPLELATATADVERARRSISDADFDFESARKDLARLTGLPSDAISIAPTPAAIQSHDLPSLLAAVDTLPSIRAANAEVTALRREAEAARLDLVPTVDAFVADRLTNASGFGEANTISAGITARFALDLPTLRRDDELMARARAAELRVEVTRREARLRIERLHLEHDNRRQRIPAASAELAARELAVSEASSRLQQGTATPLDLVIAERDRLSARLELARTEAELGLTQILLTLAAGLDPIALAPATELAPSGGPQ